MAGNNNTISGVGTSIQEGVIVGGTNNKMQGITNACNLISTILGGNSNTLNASDASVIGGGSNNRIITNSSHVNINGGCNNVIECTSFYSNIGGGAGNVINRSSNSAIVGGITNGIDNLNNTFIVGSCIYANRACTTFVNNLSIMDIPTSPTNLPSKSVWRDPSTNGLFIVP